MTYLIKRCVVCNAELHLHRRGTHYDIIGACQHIPKEKVTNCKECDYKTLFKECQW